MEISPSIYEHAAKIVDETSWRVPRDAGLMCCAHAEADSVLTLCRKRPNSCLGTGVLPYETIPENVLYYGGLCADSILTRYSNRRYLM